ncbi:molybdate ABC transporter substrate-binding protein [Sandarakinorhabdus sp.]|uniref:molybdate ABC transporter substrate-binding protein n=1 Tax=Sandarakinorhabdus sp. TaxID=1916663 RepID=UPI00286DE8A4|nr:molybdate ABC transporter substrate-binding protein [Sandarakinorhabdus sp.]
MFRRAARLCLAALLLLSVPLAAKPQPLAANPLRVAAASDLRLALGDIAAQFTRSGGGPVALTFGASGTLAQQLQQGAPHDVFLSADESLALRLADAGLTRGRGQVYAIGRLALVVRRDSGLSADLASLRADLASGRITHMAIANPATAPYGQRAVQALTATGVLPGASAKLVLGENVSQALQFVASGAAQAGVVSEALTRDPAIAAVIIARPLPANLHAPLRQRLVVMKPAGPAAQRFAAYVTGPRGRAILAAHGFALP